MHQEGEFVAYFPLDIPMVHSSMLVIATDGEHLTCGGFSLSETVCFGSLEFITDCFGSLSLFSKGSNSGAIFVGSTRSGSPSPWAMIEDFTKEFYMASSGEGGSNLPLSQRHYTGALPAPVATTPWLEKIPATQAMMIVSPRALAPWPDTDLPLSDGTLFRRGNEREPTLSKLTPSVMQRNNEASSLTSKQPERRTNTPKTPKEVRGP
jgi:hypothetical protein